MRRVASATGPIRAKTRRKLLYVEDDVLNQEVAELWLAEHYELVFALNARQALSMLREQCEQIEAILMDIELKGSELDGVELTKVLRGQDLGRPLPPFAREELAQCDQDAIREIPVFFVTAYANRVKDPTALGADGVVTKPINFFDLQMRLTQAHLKRLGSRSSRGK